MNPTNMPPDGDFARYVEKLSASNAAAGAPETVPAFQQNADQDRSVQAPATTAASSYQTAAEPLDVLLGGPFVTHIKWVIGVLIAASVLGAFFPGIFLLLILAAIIYVCWIVYRVKRHSADIWADVVDKSIQAEPKAKPKKQKQR